MPGSYCSSVDGNESEVTVKSDVECTVFLLDGNATQIPVQVSDRALHAQQHFDTCKMVLVVLMPM